MISLTLKFNLFSMAQQKPYPGTQSAIRAIALLKAFTYSQPEWRLAELSQVTGLNKTTASRLLTALESEGMVERTKDGCYRLGAEVIAMGSRAFRASKLCSASRGELKTLAETTKETATLELLRGGEIVIIDEALGRYAARSVSSIGAHWPIHATATGKLFLAYMSAAERDQLLTYPLPRYTSKTIVSAVSMRVEIAKIRRQGYAQSLHELEKDFVAVSVPIHDRLAKVVGSIGLGGSASRVTADKVPECAAMLMATASRISRRLGYISKGIQ
jgi:DNA-binding IclR family transcriptional regulator